MKDFDLRKYLAENKLLKENVIADEIASRVRKLGKEKGIEDKYIEDYIDELDGNFEPDAYENSTDKDLLDDLKSYIDLSEGRLLKEELTWFIDDENTDVRYENDAYLKEVGDKIKELHPDISSEDLNKIIIMTGEQYSREEDFHGDSIPSNNFVDAAVEIYQTDVLGSDGEDDEDFDRWAPENLDGDFPKDSRFAGWTQAQYDTYQEDPYTYLKDKTNPRLK